MRLRMALALIAGVFMTLAACSPAAGPTAASGKLRVVTTSNIVGDWVRNIAGDLAQIDSLVPAGADPHTYQPSAHDVTKVANADLIVTVGLGLEHKWLDKLIQNASADASKVVALGEGIDPIPFAGEHDDHGGGTPGPDKEEEPWDPHFWTDPVRAKTAVDLIAERLASADALRATTYRANAAAYAQKLDELDAWTKGQVAGIPTERRALVTSHETLGYFADRYEFEVIGAVIPGISTDREPTAAEMAELVNKVKEHGAPAIFTENTVSDKLAQRIAQDAGVKVVRSLYSDSLGSAGSPGDTYLGMIRANVNAIVEALR